MLRFVAPASTVGITLPLSQQTMWLQSAMLYDLVFEVLAVIICRFWSIIGSTTSLS